MADPIVRPARPEEAKPISALAIRSKAHWGYPPEQMKVFAGELTVEPRDLISQSAHVLVQDQTLLGFYTLIEEEQGSGIELEHLFLDPGVLNRGLGSRLLRHAQGLARARRRTPLRVLADPHAAGFYTARHYRHVSDVPSSIPGRSLPRFELSLASEAAPERAGSRREFCLTLESERMLLNAPHPDYSEAIVQGITESFPELNRWMPWAEQVPTLAAETTQLAESRERHAQDREATFFAFRRDDGLFLGAIGIPRMDWEKRCFEIGYWIRTSQAGKGYAAEGVRAVVAFAFGGLSARRVEIRMSEENQPSWRVAEAAGCRLEQVLEGDGVHPDGSTRNTRVYLASPPGP
jgi:RimJ/RimL family protein N-acetyltransferase/GNAT superfamily N-acetyltransferase